MLRTAVKKVIKALDANDAAGAEAAFAVAQPILDRFSARGLIHKNKAARHKSRLNDRIKALKAPDPALPPCPPGLGAGKSPAPAGFLLPAVRAIRGPRGRHYQIKPGRSRVFAWNHNGITARCGLPALLPSGDRRP